MALPIFPEAFVIKGNNAGENAVLSVLEAQIRGELRNEKSTLFMRNTVTADQITDIMGTALAVYRATLRVLWGSNWNEMTGTDRQLGQVYTTTLKIDRILSLDFNIPQFDMKRFLTGTTDVAKQVVANWMSSFMKNLYENFELIFLQGVKDYAIAKSLVLPLDLLNLTPEKAVQAFDAIGAKNNKLIKKVDKITVGINKQDITSALGIDSTLGMTKAYQRINFSQIAANTLATGRLYSSNIMGAEFYESFFLEQDFIHDTDNAMHLQKDYTLREMLGTAINRYMWGMPISFTEISTQPDNATRNPRVVGKALYALPCAIRPDLMYIIQDRMPTVAEINIARAKDLKQDFTNKNATYQSTDYDNFKVLDLNNVIYFNNLGTITMAGDTPTSAELDTAVVKAGNVGFAPTKATYSAITATSAIMTGNTTDYSGVVKLIFSKVGTKLYSAPSNIEMQNIIQSQLNDNLEKVAKALEKINTKKLVKEEDKK